MRKQADVLKVCPIPDACLLGMAQRPSRLLGLPETRSLIFLIKNSPDQAEGNLDYLQPRLSLTKERQSNALLASRISCLLGGLYLSPGDGNASGQAPESSAHFPVLQSLLHSRMAIPQCRFQSPLHHRSHFIRFLIKQ
jgi:hypothetical protein